jgi:hypothetical protein
LSKVNVLKGPAFADPLQPLLAVFPDSLTLGTYESLQGKICDRRAAS